MSAEPARRARELELIGQLAGHRVLVVGDLMLDHFLVGRVNRISPEAPVPVVEFDHEEFRLGGAANVAHTIQALGGRVSVIGTTGNDDAGNRLRAEFGRLAIDVDGLVTDPARRTTTKLRIVTVRSQQVARVDFESDDDLTGDVERNLVARVDAAVGSVDAVLVSDYLKGVVTREVMNRIVSAGRASGIPVLVDPKIPHIDYYAGATLVKPNHAEAETATHMRIRTADDVRDAARAFRRLAACESILITRGEHGMWLLEGEPTSDASSSVGDGIATEEHLPAVSREVADVTGAGDTVIGAIALALAAGASLLEAARLANHAAGVVVGKFGPVGVTTAELLDAAREPTRQ